MDDVPDTRTFEPLAGDREADIVVIGGGICGISAAWHAAQRGMSVIILEKNRVASGDTGFTTGFLTRIPDTRIFRLIETYGIDYVRRIFDFAEDAQTALFDSIRTHSLACDFERCASYYGSYRRDDPILAKEWSALQKIGGRFALVEGENHTLLAESIRIEDEGRFHPRKFINTLLKTDIGKKISVFEETEAETITASERGVSVQTKTGSIRAKTCIVAVGNPQNFFPEYESLLHPFISYVMGIRAPHHLGADVYWDTSDPYFYYRTVGDILVIGGVDAEIGRALPEEQYAKLETFIARQIIPVFQVTHRWMGSVFYTSDGLPYAFPHPVLKKVFIATGFGGNGLVFGFGLGKLLAEMAAGDTAGNGFFGRMRGSI